MDLNLDNFYDFESFEKREKKCKISCGDLVKFNNVVSCAKETGDRMAEDGLKRDIIVYYEEKARSVRKYIPKDYDENEYRSFLAVIDPYRQEEEGIHPIITEIGYYTDWIEIR